MDSCFFSSLFSPNMIIPACGAYSSHHINWSFSNVTRIRKQILQHSEEQIIYICFSYFLNYHTQQEMPAFVISLHLWWIQRGANPAMAPLSRLAIDFGFPSNEGRCWETLNWPPQPNVWIRGPPSRMNVWICKCTSSVTLNQVYKL